MHLLQGLRGKPVRERLSELRGRILLAPIRPARNWKGDNFLGKYPASTTVKYRPANPDARKELAAKVGSLPPEER
jgi:hypothetical protein